MTKPVIVLVRPQLGENIGKAARAMLNFGLTEMRLVTPRDGWPNPSAGPAASGADIVLDQARVFDSVAEAVADCAHVFATTVRKRGVTKPVLTPEEAARDIRAESGRSAILFGAERSGLETEDVALARAIVTDPTLLLCDEPTGDLDRKAGDEILDLLVSLNRDHGKTIVMVTHDPRAAERAQRTLHLEKGELTRDAA